MVPLVGILLALLIVFSSVTGGFLGTTIVTLSLATAILFIALRSFLRPDAFRTAVATRPWFLDPRSVFARSARVAPSGEVLVSYTRYRQVYRATAITVSILLTLLGVSLVLALLRAGYPSMMAPR